MLEDFLLVELCAKFEEFGMYFEELIGAEKRLSLVFDFLASGPLLLLVEVLLEEEGK